MSAPQTPRGDSWRRAVRTLLDVLLAVLAAGVVDAFLVNLDPTQRGALVVALTGAISVVKNALEDRGAIPAVLKAPASSGANPVPEGAETGGSTAPPDTGSRRLEAEEYPPEDRAGY